MTMTTNIERDLRTVRKFLTIPVTALPGATWRVQDDSDLDNAWEALYEFVALGRPWIGEEIILRADRDGWRDGVTVSV